MPKYSMRGSIFTILLSLLFCPVAFSEAKASDYRFPKGFEDNLLKSGYKVLSKKVIGISSDYTFRLPEGATEVGYLMDSEFLKLRDNGYRLLPIKLKISTGGESRSAYGAKLTKTDGTNFDESIITVSNISKLERKVLIYWK